MTRHLHTTEDLHDLIRGVAAHQRSPLLADLAEAIARHPDAPFPNAFNMKQIASKLWLLDELHGTLGGSLGVVAVLGGWLGVLSALLLNDPRFAVSRIVSLDIDPACAPVATTLNRRFAGEGRFQAVTDDMHAVDWAALEAEPGARDSLIVNTSAEHIPDPGAWARTLPTGVAVLVQSNNYRAVPEHVSCVDSADELASKLGLSQVLFTGALAQRRYTRFMVIGRR
jgi:hypothetical protein